MISIFVALADMDLGWKFDAGAVSAAVVTRGWKKPDPAKLGRILNQEARHDS